MKRSYIIPLNLSLLFLIANVLFSSSVMAQNSAIPEDLSSPQSTVYTFINNTQGENPEWVTAGWTLRGVKGQNAVEKAQKLSKLLTAKGLKVRISTIPSQPDYTDTISGIDIAHRYVLFPAKLPDLYVEKAKGQSRWYFSKSSVEKIDEWYKETFPYEGKVFERISKVFGDKKVLGIEIHKIVGVVILIALAFVLVRLLKRLIYLVFNTLGRRIYKSESLKMKKGLNQMHGALAYLLVIQLIIKVLPTFQFDINTSNFLFNGFDYATIILWTGFFMYLISNVAIVYKEFAAKENSKLDVQFIPIVKNLFRGIVLIIGLLQLLSVAGVNPNSVLAGVSIGGLALALSAQDTVKNLLGSLMIFLDRPFQIGDWIEAGQVSGTVEEVGFRSSRIRTFDTSVYYIPNSQLAELIINNKQARKLRRYTTTIGVRYDTPPDMLQKFIEGIKELILKHPNTNKEKFNVEFEAFGNSSLNILVNVYFERSDWDNLQRSKHILHMGVLTLANTMGLSFAFPSTTVMIEQFPEKTGFDMQYDANREGYKSALKGAVNEVETQQDLDDATAKK